MIPKEVFSHVLGDGEEVEREIDDCDDGVGIRNGFKLLGPGSDGRLQACFEDVPFSA